MKIKKDLNYSKYGLRKKLACLAVIIYMLWDVDLGLFPTMHFFLDTKPQLGASSGSLWEWYFRSSLDHWSTFFGMLFALNFPITSLFLRKLEAQTPWKCFAAKTLVGIPLLVTFVIWVAIPFRYAKPQYNQTNAYFGFIPLITYIYFRNLTLKLRSYSLNLLHEIGKTTLETYLMQHHIWLTSNAKTLLTIIPGHPKINMLVVTFIYFVTSRKLYKLTLYLRGMLLPDNKNTCIKSILCLASVVGMFCGLAFMLQELHMLNLPIIGLVSIVCGNLVYAVVVKGTGAPPTDAVTENIDSNSSKQSSERKIKNRFSSFTAGAMLVLSIGLIWKKLAVHGYGKVGPLRSECKMYANNGVWVPANDCNEATMGALHRKHGIANLATCNTANTSYVWGWKNSKSFNHCRFTQRSAKELKKTLKKRKVMFLGDVTTRNIYHAVCRSLGKATAGEFDANVLVAAPVNEEIQIGDIELSFDYAMDTANQFGVLGNIRERYDANQIEKADLIIIGGGISDCKAYQNEDLQVQLEKQTANLLTEIKKFKYDGIPIAWITPTAVNYDAIPVETEPFMIEDNVEALRKLQESQGILDLSAFVIDGPSFTEDIKNLAFDGISYPPLVYDAGAQIFANSLDWSLPSKPLDLSEYSPPQPGSMSHPYLGLMMFFFASTALFFFDGFMGFSYMAALVAKGVKPSELYDEAFGKLHKKMKLPDISSKSPVKSLQLSEASRSHVNATLNTADKKPNEEAASLIENQNHKL